MSLKDTFNLKIKTDIHKISTLFWIMLIFIVARSAWVLFNHAFDVPLTDPDFPWENIFLTLSALVIAVVALKGWFETFKVLFEMNENLEAMRDQQEKKQ
jgi:hypothetical protein